MKEDITEKKSPKRSSQEPIPYVAPVSPKLPKTKMHAPKGKEYLQVPGMGRKVTLLPLNYMLLGGGVYLPRSGEH